MKRFIKTEVSTKQNTTRQNTSTPSKTLPKIVDHEPDFIDPDYQLDFYWD